MKRINPPRTMYWKPEYGNFESYWKEHIDKWIETKPLLESIIDEYQNRSEFFEQLRALRRKPDDDEEDIDEEADEVDDTVNEESNINTTPVNINIQNESRKPTVHEFEP